MPNTDQAELAKFHKLCGVSIIVEADGTNPVLCVSASVRDRTTGKYHDFKRAVALDPLMRMLADRIRVYHDMLHSNTNVSGKLPSACDDYDWDLGDYQNWKEGERHWRGLGKDIDHPQKQSFYNAPEFLDDAGLPPGVDPLQVQGWFDKIKKTARHLGEIKAVKTLYKDLKTYGNKAASYAQKGAKWAEAHKNELATAAAMAGAGPLGAAALKTGFKVYDAVQAAKKNNPEALLALKKIKTLAEEGDFKAIEAYKAAQYMNDMLKEKESKTQVSGDGYMVQGWLYNRPYRTNAQVLLDAATGKFPTVSLALREGWHDGLNFVGSMKRKNISLLGK